MKDLLARLEAAQSLQEICALTDRILPLMRDGRAKMGDCRRFLRALLFHEMLADQLQTHAAVDHLRQAFTPEEWGLYCGDAAAKELPGLIVDLIDGLKDVSHDDLLGLLPPDRPKDLIPVLKKLDTYLSATSTNVRYLRGMRACLIQTAIYRRLQDPKLWKRRSIPSCALDGKTIAGLKEAKDIQALPAAYEKRINQLQRADLRQNLAALDTAPPTRPRMHPEDFDKTFVVRAPLRLGISSANASDNHLRSKEQGGKTLNAGIDLVLEGDTPSPPLAVSVRRLPKLALQLRSLSKGFDADFELRRRGDAQTQSALFFAYRRSGDEALRLVKQALVHSGIVGPSSQDVLGDIAAFTDGGGLEITTSSQVLQGSGLGTSSILAAAVLKTLYRLTQDEAADPRHEYPRLYDQSLLLEQNLGLNSGWQDARGACGGPSAVKDFYAPPTAELPAPQLRFVAIDAQQFVDRVILFDTGIARSATRGLNVVLDAYLSRSPQRYAAVRQSLALHDEMVQALQAADYPSLGRMASRYWRLRCQLDPEATNAHIQHLYEAPELVELCDGGMLTGAGGGGFGLFIARQDCGDELIRRLQRLRESPAYQRSAVVAYRLNPAGLAIEEETDA